jgi:hypothetical protein
MKEMTNKELEKFCREVRMLLAELGTPKVRIKRKLKVVQYAEPIFDS